MIDPEWLIHAGMMADAPVADGDAQRLTRELGEEAEVLPWLLVMRGGFAEWPAARAALKEASTAVIRPRALAQDARASGGAGQRDACRQALLRAIAVTQESDRWAVDEMNHLRQHISSRPQPNHFIAVS